MSYWENIKSSFSKISDENLKRLKFFSEDILQKAREGGETLAEKSKEEFETLKLKYELHRKRSQMLDDLGELGGLFFESHKKNEDISANEKLHRKIAVVAKIEKKCNEIENSLKNMGKDSDLEDKDFMNQPKLMNTPY